MIFLAVFTGMRPSAYRGLSWANLEIDRVHVRQRADKDDRIGTVKSRAGRRTIFIPQSVGEMVPGRRNVRNCVANATRIESAKSRSFLTCAEAST
ncbi:hypothetical protein AC244_33395 [Ensifer adhaerens]|uniref:Tyr recombinase domain-containing protein n=1 Tax=Ensifer adhaerens TaxID=106592 RepID=A0A0L8BDH6_ENSAD|nr:hypothetical protein AC244_33395 [Ensifer adhaerens]